MGYRSADPNTAEVSLSELCDMLSISTATGKNWIRLGRLTPQRMSGKTAYFSLEYANSVKRDLRKSDNALLKRRRNKKYISGSNVYDSYLSDCPAARDQVQSVLDYIQTSHMEVGDLQIRALVAECALQLLLRGIPSLSSTASSSGPDTTASSTVSSVSDTPTESISSAGTAADKDADTTSKTSSVTPSEVSSMHLPSGNCLESFLQGDLELNGYRFLIDDLLRERAATLSFIQRHPDLFHITYPYERGEDILGLLYISMKNLGDRKVTGSYYTPERVVRKLFDRLFEDHPVAGKTILDPCCGTGSFFIQLPPDIPCDHIYGCDIDELSVKIARINLALRFPASDRETLYSHITKTDYLDHSFTEKFDFIIGNPPWGYDYTREEMSRLKEKYTTASGTGIESYDLFVEQAIGDLSRHGVLSFVLPEALLNVKAHTSIRSILIANSEFQYVEYLGSVFGHVQCPCVILQVGRAHSPADCVGMEVNDGLRRFRIRQARALSPECFHFLTTDREYRILQKISAPGSKRYLKNNATFALGIVTGDNKRHITQTKTDHNEIILKGSDLRKYRYNVPSNYIDFRPQSFQQVAPADRYRAPEKLLYRFICNQLVFAYDDRQTLSLNSCNILIPKIDGLCVKYVLALLNSRIVQYYFRKTFHSVKVLRSHLEQIPIPFLTKKQQEPILEKVETILAAQDSDLITRTYDELDEQIRRLYKLTDREYAMIRESMEGENLFLS